MPPWIPVPQLHVIARSRKADVIIEGAFLLHTPCTRLLSKTANAIAVVLALAVVARLHTIQHSVTFVCRTQKAKAELFRSMPRPFAAYGI